jgi:hypothetical protein
LPVVFYAQISGFEGASAYPPNRFVHSQAPVFFAGVTICRQNRKPTRTRVKRRRTLRCRVDFKFFVVAVPPLHMPDAARMLPAIILELGEERMRPYIVVAVGAITLSFTAIETRAESCPPKGDPCYKKTVPIDPCPLEQCNVSSECVPSCSRAIVPPNITINGVSGAKIMELIEQYKQKEKQ